MQRRDWEATKRDDDDNDDDGEIGTFHSIPAARVLRGLMMKGSAATQPELTDDCRWLRKHN